MVLAIVAALGSALLVAIGSVLQHRAGHRPSAPSLLKVLRHPLWIAGATTGVAGFGLHVLALSNGPLSIVQPLLVCGLLFALPLSLVLEHRAPRAVDTLAAAAVVGGLAIFQLAARPTLGRSVAAPAALVWCAAVTTLLVIAGVLVAMSGGVRRSLWLGWCSGAAYGLAAALMKAVVGLIAAGGTEVLHAWPLYGFAVVVSGAIAVNQLAFNAGPLAESLPLITIVDPVVAVVIGAVAFGETLTSAPGLVLGQVLGFLVMSVGVVMLCRSPDGTADAAATPAARAGLVPVSE